MQTFLKVSAELGPDEVLSVATILMAAGVMGAFALNDLLKRKWPEWWLGVRK